jgi:Barrel-sandwich domain of CusB or HlyD membrane-fusion
VEQQRQQLKVLDSQESQATASLKGQQAARDLSKIALGYTRIAAPVDGMVGQRQVRPGQYVSTGTQVIALIPLPNVWVIANYKETQMTRIRVDRGQRLALAKTSHCMTSIDNLSPIGDGSIPGALSPPGARVGQPAPAVSTRPLVGVVGVLIGSIISTLAGRLTSFGWLM